MKLTKYYLSLLKKAPWFIPLVLGSLIRFIPPLISSFPLNDGGMFYSMIEDLKNANLALPSHTTYNQQNIPFTYPPLAFYLLIIVQKVSSIDTLTLFRFLPALLSSLTILAFYLLATKLTSRKTTIYSTLVFSLIPTGFIWQIMGGGLTRSFGFLFSLFSLSALIEANRANSGVKQAFIAALLLGLTILGHLQWFFFAVYSFAIFLIFQARQKSFQKALQILIVSFILIAPWLVTIVTRHGTSPFSVFLFNGIDNGNDTFSIYNIFLKVTDEPMLNIFAVFAVISALNLISQNKYFLAAWMVFPILFVPRTAAIFASVPISLLAGDFIVNILKPNFLHKKSKKNTALKFDLTYSLPIFAYSFIAAIVLIVTTKDFGSISESQRRAMIWSKSTPINSSFLIVSSSTNWAKDPVSEWFPTISKRKSITTPQGTEWLKGKVFSEKVSLHNSIKDCYSVGIQCIEKELDTNHESVDYIFLDNSINTKKYSALLKYQLDSSTKYESAFEDNETIIYKNIAD